MPAGGRVELVTKFGRSDIGSAGKLSLLNQKLFLEKWREFSFVVEDDYRRYFPI
jgi:hypothetical protein